MSSSDSDSDSDVDQIGWENPTEAIEFEKHNIGCLRAVVRLVKTAKFRFHSKSGWNVSRRLQEIIGEPDNSVQLADLAYFVHVPKYITNEFFEAPDFWLHYLDLLPIDVALPEEVRACLNSVYNKPVKGGPLTSPMYIREQTLKRTFRLLPPGLRQQFMQRIVWGACGFSKFTCEELQRMGWNSSSNPCWLMSMFWKSDGKAKFIQNQEKVKRLFPGYYANKICQIACPRLSSDSQFDLSLKFCNRFNVWPLITHHGSVAAVFYLQELELQRASYLIVDLGLSPPIAWQLAEDRVIRQTNYWKKLFMQKPENFAN